MKTYTVQIMKETPGQCGCVTIDDPSATMAGRLTNCGEWHGEPIDKFVTMCNRNGLKLVEHWKSSVGNQYLTFA